MENLRKAFIKAISSNSLKDRNVFFELLHQRCYLTIFYVVKNWFPNNANDISNDIMLKFFSKDLAKLKVLLKDPCAYTAQTARNHCLDLWKKRVAQEQFLNDYFIFQQKQSFVTQFKEEPGFLTKERLDIYLNPKQLEAIWLKFYDGLEYYEIRKKLDCQSNTAVRMTVNRGLKNLRKGLKR